MSYPTILTIDLNFMQKAGTIGVYLLPHSQGGLLVESGPTSTIPELIEGLKHYGFTPLQITDVFLTHIHLDHAGAAGWLAQQGARIHVHSAGAPHLINPAKLLASAARVYGDQMEALWGLFSHVPEAQINILQDSDIVTVGELSIKALEVLGHAVHHLAYLIDGACFTGDIGGVRVHNQKFISLPTPPPDLNLEQWRASILRLLEQKPRQIIPTHFGVYNDPEWHLNKLLGLLTTLETWIENKMPEITSIEELRQEYLRLEIDRSRQAGLQDLTFDAQQTANPYSMSADGIYRYWHKVRLVNNNRRIEYEQQDQSDPSSSKTPGR